MVSAKSASLVINFILFLRIRFVPQIKPGFPEAVLYPEIEIEIKYKAISFISGLKQIEDHDL